MTQRPVNSPKSLGSAAVFSESEKSRLQPPKTDGGHIACVIHGCILCAVACCLHRQFGKTLPGLDQRGFLGCLAHVESFGIDELDIGNPQKSKKIAHVASLAI